MWLEKLGIKLISTQVVVEVEVDLGNSFAFCKSEETPPPDCVKNHQIGFVVDEVLVVVDPKNLHLIFAKHWTSK